MEEDFINKYEITRILGERANQLSSGAPTLIDYKSLRLISAIEIAKKELEKGIIPLLVERTLPDGRVLKIIPKINQKDIERIYGIS